MPPVYAKISYLLPRNQAWNPTFGASRHYRRLLRHVGLG